MQDEARHVAFGTAHLRRHDALKYSLRKCSMLAAGAWDTESLRTGPACVMGLVDEMNAGRVQRLSRLGFGEAEAIELAGFHTRNFM